MLQQLALFLPDGMRHMGLAVLLFGLGYVVLGPVLAAVMRFIRTALAWCCE